MADRDRLRILTDAQWEVLAPLIAACRPPYKTDHHDLRRTIEAIIWRHDNGAKWRQIPAELGPWWMAAQCLRPLVAPGRLGTLAGGGAAAWRGRGRDGGPGGVRGSASDPRGTSIRAHHKAAGAAKKGDPQRSATRMGRLAVRAAGTGPRLA
jgi:transposase